MKFIKNFNYINFYNKNRLSNKIIFKLNFKLIITNQKFDYLE